MKLDLDKEGLEALFSPWQVEVMRLLWGAGEEVDSRTAHEYLRKSGAHISRASIIMFLNMMAEEGLIEYRDISRRREDGSAYTGRARQPLKRVPSGSAS